MRIVSVIAWVALGIALTGCAPAGGGVLGVVALLLLAGCGRHQPSTLPDAGDVSFNLGELCSDAGEVVDCPSEPPVSCQNCFCGQAYRDCGNDTCAPIGSLCAPCPDGDTVVMICANDILEPCCSTGAPDDYCVQQMQPFAVCAFSSPLGCTLATDTSCSHQGLTEAVTCPGGYQASEICGAGGSRGTCCSMDGACGTSPAASTCPPSSDGGQ